MRIIGMRAIFVYAFPSRSSSLRLSAQSTMERDMGKDGNLQTETVCDKPTGHGASKAAKRKWRKQRLDQMNAGDVVSGFNMLRVMLGTVTKYCIGKP